MTTTLDASAVVAFLKDEIGADAVEALLEHDKCSLTTLALAEVLDHIVRVGGRTEEGALLDIDDLDLAPALELDTTGATEAALLRARHYHRKTRVVSLADCVAAQAARATDSALATSDPHLLDLCHDEGIAVIPLSDSKGNIWTPH